jgi:hypothetical protein
MPCALAKLDVYLFKTHMLMQTTLTVGYTSILYNIHPWYEMGGYNGQQLGQRQHLPLVDRT